jgi:peptidoglycan-associated lipoprotein
MKRKWMVLTLMPALLLVLWGCPKKKPATPEPELEVVSEPVDDTTMMPEPEPEPMVQDEVEPGLPDDLVELNDYVQRQGLIQDVYFAFDQADLTEEARARLANNADFMRQHPEYLFSVEGHCDERGTNEYNLALGNRRASSAVDYISSLGIDAGSMRTISYGEERPFCTESSEGCWQQNRRAHFVVTGRR